MPNWTDNRLYITVPPENLTALVDELRGPRDWFFPFESYERSLGNLDAVRRLTALQRAEIVSRSEEIKKSMMASGVVPDGYEPTDDDAFGNFFINFEEPCPVSFPRHMPMSMEELEILASETNAITP